MYLSRNHRGRRLRLLTGGILILFVAVAWHWYRSPKFEGEIVGVTANAGNHDYTVVDHEGLIGCGSDR